MDFTKISYELAFKLDFIRYTFEFYGPGGLYDLNATPEQILMASSKLISQKGYDFAGDSVDRERVRDILIDDFKLKYIDEK